MPVNRTVSSQLLHLPLTLDTQRRGWSGTHLFDTLSLSLSLYLTCTLFSLSHYSSHSHIQFEELVCDCTNVTNENVFESSPFSRFLFLLQSNTSCSH